MNLDPKNLTDDPETVTAPADPVTVPSIDITDDIVERVNAITPGDITPEQIRAVLAATNHASGGAPVGTRLEGPSGETATRVCRNGVNMWAIVHPDGGFTFDMEPTLPWTTLNTAGSV